MRIKGYLDEIHLVNQKDGHNKFYDLFYNENNDTYTAIWGKVGTYGQRKEYSPTEAERKYYEKLDKGYTEEDQTFGLMTYEDYLRELD